MSGVRTAGVVAAAALAGCFFDTSGAAIDGRDAADVDAEGPRDSDAARPPGIDAARPPDIDAARPLDGAPPDAFTGDTIVYMTLTTAIDHGRLGNLTIKLRSPEGTTLGVISRPGFYEDADDGSDAGTAVQYDASGDQSDLHAGAPITFRDDAVVDGEDMGHDLFGVGTAVCEDEPICDYLPNPGAVGGPTRFADAFAGQTKLGAWRLCVADSHGDSNPDGALQAWRLSITTSAGTADYEAVGLGIVIQDDTYDGSLESMRCHTMVVMD